MINFFQQLANTTTPLTKVISEGDGYKIIALGLKKGMLLKAHTTPVPAKLLVISGIITYKEIDHSKILKSFDESEIPMNVIHSVECIEDAFCLLIKTKK